MKAAPLVAADASTFGKLLRCFRVRAGLTQEMLAERASVSLPTIAALEQGVRQRPYPHTLLALSQALGLDPADSAALHERASGARVRMPGPPRPTTPLLAPVPLVPSRDATVQLPAPTTALIGREADVDAVSKLLLRLQPTPRLLTLVGPGGVGKSRLSLAVAFAVADAYANGVVFVDLASLQDHRLIPATIAGALHVHAVGGLSMRDIVFSSLHDRTMLLVLDNLEHLVSGARWLGELLVACPRVTLLATSRTACELSGGTQSSRWPSRPATSHQSTRSPPRPRCSCSSTVRRL